MTIRRRQHDLRSPDELARGVPVGEQGLEFSSVIAAQVMADVIASHVPTLTRPTAPWNPPSGAEH